MFSVSSALDREGWSGSRWPSTVTAGQAPVALPGVVPGAVEVAYHDSVDVRVPRFDASDEEVGRLQAGELAGPNALT